MRAVRIVLVCTAMQAGTLIGGIQFLNEDTPHGQELAKDTNAVVEECAMFVSCEL